MIYWKPFTHIGETFELTHLHPEIWEFKQPAKGKNPARIYKIRIIYSLHCFTIKQVGTSPSELNYSDNRETREFCFERYQTSLQLQE